MNIKIYTKLKKSFWFLGLNIKSFIKLEKEVWVSQKSFFYYIFLISNIKMWYYLY